MSDLLAARFDMALSLGFHILFAAAGIAMPLFMAVSEARWLRTRDPVDLELTKRWMKGTAILFAVGAVSGTVLSFELGLLWPNFMRWAGPVIGMPFSLEGFAFFLEAIFLGLYLYGWGRIPDRLHWWTGVGVAASGVLSGIFVVCANAWMNSPAGFRLVNGRPVDIDPFAAMFNAAAFQQALHMTIAAYAAVAFAAAGIHALVLLRHPAHALHRRAFSIVFPIAVVSALLQPVSGDVSAKWVARHQPAKLAAMEAHFQTERGAALHIGGWPDVAAGTTRGSLRVPKALSILATGNPDAEVLGLADIPRDEWPPVLVVHLAFQVMVACGAVLLAVGLLGAGLRLRGLDPVRVPWFLRLVVAASPLGLVAIEAGWIVTEVGRQPWIVYGVMRTSEAVTPMPGVLFPLVSIALLYLLLGVVVVALLRRQVFATVEDR